VAAVQYYGTGRRKTSTARVFLRPGSGSVTINHRAFEQFFKTEALRMQIRTPLVLTETADKFDILATVAGGGVSGQAGAVRLGISRALVEYNGELRKKLKDEGLLTRDARAKERKKYGMAGARKRFQFSKR
jgi:small subunit ribosomal protein S9